VQRFVVLGCNHSSASLDEIASARVAADAQSVLLAELRDRLEAQELVYLETCHRTEWYLAYEGEMCPGRLTLALSTLLPSLGEGRSRLPEVERCVALQGEKAARHLFRVASALDALMIGETQVLGQVKEAYRNASAAGLSGPQLRMLFEQAFRTAKRIRTETALSRRPVSLVSLAAKRMKSQMRRAPGPVAILGAGSMASMSAELVRKIDPGRAIVIFNRSLERAESLARTFGAKAARLADFPAKEEDGFAAVITATRADRPLITRAEAESLAPALLLDLSLPPNVAPECAQVPGVTVIGQEELAEEAQENRAARADEIDRAEAILDEQLEELAYEVVETFLSPVARSLVEAFREVARGELERFCSDVNVAHNGELDEAVERLSKRLLRVPMRGLREVAWLHSPEVLSTFLAAVER
jgi:glutamyl-tRNA reductase